MNNKTKSLSSISKIPKYIDNSILPSTSKEYLTSDCNLSFIEEEYIADDEISWKHNAAANFSLENEIVTLQKQDQGYSKVYEYLDNIFQNLEKLDINHNNIDMASFESQNKSFTNKINNLNGKIENIKRKVKQVQSFNIKNQNYLRKKECQPLKETKIRDSTDILFTKS